MIRSRVGLALVLLAAFACRPQQLSFTIPICDAKGVGCGCAVAGWILCGEVCVDPEWDRDHCGGCDQGCGAGTVCNQGQCSADCGTATTCGGTCARLAVDLRNCGSCGEPCDGTCHGGVCQPRTSDCPASLSLCPGGCVDLDSDPDNCGQCGVGCPGACFVDPGGTHLCCLGTLCGDVCLPPGESCP